MERRVAPVRAESRGDPAAGKAARLLRNLVRQGHSLLAAAWQVSAHRRRLFAVSTCAGLALVGAAIALDHPLDDFIRSGRSPGLEVLAGHLRRWGRGFDTLFWVSVALLLALRLRRPEWKRAALAALLAMAVAGLAVNVLRVATGRPRPRASPPTAWVGPTLTYSRQSFPSGHAAASFASATVLATALPGVGVPALASAAGVSWASLYTRNHYATDILAGAAAGVLIGLALGLAARGGTKG
jgi:undecaprenyl-diphosphatase